MGDVLVRKARLSPQIDLQTGNLTAPVNVGMGGRRGSTRFATPAGLERTPRAAAAARDAGAKAAANLARMPSSGSVDDPNVGRQIGIQRSRAKDAVRDAAPRSLQEKIGVKTFNRLQDKGYDSDFVDRASARAGKVGVRGAKIGQGLGNLAGIGMGILSGASALSDASAAGQDFGGAIAGAGLRGLTTTSTVTDAVNPTLTRTGARLGGRIGVRNQLRDEMKDAQFAAKQPVAVAPPTAPPTASPVATSQRPVLPTKPIFTGQGPTTQMRYSQQLTPDQLRARQANIETSAKYNMGPTTNQQAELRHIDRQLNPTTAGQPFNPQVQEGAMAEMFGQRASYTPGSGQFSIPGPQPVTAEPTKNPVAVQQKITTPEQANEALFGKPPEGSVENMNMQEATGAADKAASALTGMGSMAGQSSAGNQQKPEEDEKGQVQGG